MSAPGTPAALDLVENLYRVFAVAEMIADDAYFDGAEPAIRRLRELVAEGRAARAAVDAALAGRAA